MEESVGIIMHMYIPYSWKFSRVQNVADSPLRAPEENFVVLIFVVSAHRGRQGAIDIALVAIFTVFIFVEGDLSMKTAKFCTTQKFLAIQYDVHCNSFWTPVCMHMPTLGEYVWFTRGKVQRSLTHNICRGLRGMESR